MQIRRLLGVLPPRKILLRHRILINPRIMRPWLQHPQNLQNKLLIRRRRIHLRPANVRSPHQGPGRNISIRLLRRPPTGNLPDAAFRRRIIQRGGYNSTIRIRSHFSILSRIRLLIQHNRPRIVTSSLRITNQLPAVDPSRRRTQLLTRQQVDRSG